MNSRRIGLGLIIYGLLQLLFGVIYLLEASNGPGTGPKTFSQRRSYNQVKTDLHRALPVGGSLALSGLLIVMGGSHLRKRATMGENPSDGDHQS